MPRGKKRVASVVPDKEIVKRSKTMCDNMVQISDVTKILELYQGLVEKSDDIVRSFATMSKYNIEIASLTQTLSQMIENQNKNDHTDARKISHTIAKISSFLARCDEALQPGLSEVLDERQMRLIKDLLPYEPQKYKDFSPQEYVQKMQGLHEDIQNDILSLSKIVELSKEIEQICSTFKSNRNNTVKDIVQFLHNKIVTNNNPRFFVTQHAIEKMKKELESLRDRVLQIESFNQAFITVHAIRQYMQYHNSALYALLGTPKCIPEPFSDDETLVEIYNRTMETIKHPPVANYVEENANLSQRWGWPLFLPFNPAHAIQEEKQKFFLNRYPCVPVPVPGDYDLDYLVEKCLDNIYGTTLVLPKLLCILVYEGNYCLIFEEPVGKKLIDHVSKATHGCNSRHMLIDFCAFMKNLVAADRKIDLTPDDFIYCPNGTLTLSPHVFASLSACPLDGSISRRLPIKSLAFPDSCYHRNYGNIYVGWLFYMLRFKTQKGIAGIHNNPLIENLPNDEHQILKTCYEPMKYGEGDKLTHISNRFSIWSRKDEAYNSNIRMYPRRTREDVTKVLEECKNKMEQSYQENMDITCLIQNEGDKFRELDALFTNLGPEPFYSVGKFELIRNGQKAQGTGPLRSCIMLYMEEFVQHSIMIKIGKEYIFNLPSKVASIQCPKCQTTCHYFPGIPISFVNAWLVALYYRLRLPFTISHIVIAIIQNNLSCDSIDELFESMGEEYFTPLHHFGPVQRADNGDVLTYQIGNLKDPFDIPGTVDLKRECPELGLDIVTTPRNAILHIAETLKMYAKNVAEWMFIRKINNVNTKDLFKMDLDQLHEFLCKTDSYVDESEFFSHLKFVDENGKWSADEIQLFCSYFKGPEGDHRRSKFLSSVAASNTIDGKISISKESKRAKGALLIRSCFQEIYVPKFQNKEQLYIILEGSFGDDYNRND